MPESMMNAFTRGCARAAALALCLAVTPAFALVPADAISFTNATTNWVDGDLVLTFQTGEGSLKLNGPASARFLLVGGGGSGGKATATGTGSGGGGGAGGFYDTETSVLCRAGTYNVTVGAGGPCVTALAAGTNGLDSVVTGPDASELYRVLGGGGGGGGVNAAKDGGSGGGASRGSSGTVEGAAGTEGQGNKGGDCGNFTQAAGGGGGAGEAGYPGTAQRISGNGGAGKASDITGSSVVYAGGGGGGARGAGTAGNGGAGGGGNGAVSTTAATDGVDGLGGGGGGANNSNPSGKGGDGVVIIRISDALAGPIVKPTSGGFVYDGSNHVKMARNDFAYTIAGTAEATDAGNYSFRVELNGDLKWSDGSQASVSVDWTIAQASNAISGFALEGWTYGTAPNAPTCTADFGEVVYTYSSDSTDGDDGTWAELTAAELAELPPGQHWVKAHVEETPNWRGATAALRFTVMSSPKSSLHNSVTLKLSGYTGTETLTDFPVLVRLGSDIRGFDLSGTSPDAIAFSDADGHYLSYEVDTWGPGGAAVWVKVPVLTPGTTEIGFHWDVIPGMRLPANDPTDVWTRYLMVLHGNDFKNSAGGSIDIFPPADGGVVVSNASGRLGAGFLKTNYTLNGLSFTNPHLTGAIDVGGQFSLYGWFRRVTTSGISNNGTFILGGSKREKWENPGFVFMVEKGSALDVGVGSSHQCTSSQSLPAEEWAFAGFTYDNDQTLAVNRRLAIYRNDAQVYYKESALSIVDSGTDVWSIGAYVNGTSGDGYKGDFDEFRLFNGFASKAWMKAEYQQLAGGFYEVGESRRDGKYVNYWVREPSVDKTTWRIGETATAIDDGEPAFGTSTHKFVRCSDGTELDGLPDEAGVYEIVFTAGTGAAEETFTVATYALRVSITEPKQYSEMSTAEARLMLAGDEAGEAPVTGQAYWLDEGHATYWVHSGLGDEAVGNLLPFTTHEFLDGATGARLWYMTSVRIGNTMPATGSGVEGLDPVQNYLPWAEPVQKSSRESLKPSQIGRSEVAQMVMRNEVGAAVYSSCYTNGIGTIYFDAVNAWTNAWYQDVGPDDRLGTEDDVFTPMYRLAVYVATDVLDAEGNSLPPTDANLLAADGSGIDYERANWRRLPLEVLKRDYAPDATGDRPFVRVAAEAGARDEFWNAADRTAVNLMVGNGGTAGNFYRIYIPLNVMQPIRFKIVRETCCPRAGDPDTYGQILLDNIIVSHPQMRADLETWPQVGEEGLETYGRYDISRKGKLTLGYEAAWLSPFPAADEDIYVRAKPVYYTSGGAEADVSSFVIGAFLNYRWRYLDQTTNRTAAVYGWQTVALNPNDGYRAHEPLNLPGIVGDVEFYYTTYLNAPYYEYMDYTGTGLKLSGLYSEELACVTNRASAAEGRDWFVRLRDGKSDFEEIRLVTVSGGDETVVTNVVQMEIVDDHTWRGYLQTLEATAELSYHFEARNRQTPGAEVWNVSCDFWKADRDTAESWVDASVAACGSNEWSKIGCDAVTGYLLFQLDDTTHALTVVHADYQNFNSWNDANRIDRRFVGNSTKDDEKSGASPQAVEMSENFAGWRNMSETNTLWSEDFEAFERQEYADYEPFSSSLTPNGWSAGPGKWVYGRFRDPRTGRAFQMQGQGHGFLQFVDAAKSPRGLKSISFNARLGQSIGASDFSYFDSADKTALKDYTLFACVAYDTVTNASFSGNASLSMIGAYCPGVGFYEFRIEQVLASPNTGSNPTEKADKNSVALALYRWLWDEYTGKVETSLLGVTTNTNVTLPISTNGENGDYIPMFFSVSSDGDIYGGVCHTGMKPWKSTDAGSFFNDKKWTCIGYHDSLRALSCGTYGVLSANCEGVFCEPTVLDSVVQIPTNGTTDVKYYGEFVRAREQIVPIKPNLGTECFNDLKSPKRWFVTPGRMQRYGLSGGSTWGLKAVVPAQTLGVYTSPAGKTEWSAVASCPVTSFNSRNGNFLLPLYTTTDCSVKIQHVGDDSDMRTDVVIDDVELVQWRGGAWTDQSEMQPLIPNWTREEDYKAHTNFTFTSAWIRDESLLLSAKRTAPGTPCGIRSPLFDGSYGRGLGEGMISFAYSNAQENVNLLVQVATNVGWAEVNNINNLDPNMWTTVTNFDFSTFSEEARAGGTLGCYIGYHGAQGVMRLLIDPEVVDAVVNETDPARFGEITITEVFCRDEPVLDSGCWWGWNLRTFGPVDSELRMYLPDVTDGLAEQGLSLALNNSISADILPNDPETYRQHVPFLQTPTFVSNIVGEVSFKARKYEGDDSGQPAQITLYGSTTGAELTPWTRLKTFIVTNSVYETYSYKTEPGETFAAFRLAVTGVPGVSDPYMGNPAPEGYDLPLRVLIDEVLVMEAVRPRVGFRFVGAFRSDLSGTAWVPDVPGVDEQPLCGESFGIQCEVYAAQLPDEIDFTRNPMVRLWWIEGFDPWGFENWRTNAAAHSAWLARATGTNLVYRSSYTTAPDAIITPLSTSSGTTVQYALEVIYYEVGASKPATNFISAIDWERPYWYAPVDYNRQYGSGAKQDFSAYCILDTVAPYWAWINEVNVYGEWDLNYQNTERDRQFVEIAVPQEADISGWRVEALEAQLGTGLVITNVLGVFGSGGLEPMKPDMIGAEMGMVYRVISCPDAVKRLSRADGELDSTWDFGYVGEYTNRVTTTFQQSGEIYATELFALRLVRLSGVVEHEIMTRGQDWFAAFPEYADESLVTNNIAFLESRMPGSHFDYVGDDDGGLENSLGVVNERGRTTNVWSKAMHLTPGRINEGQVINPDHPTPNGSSVIIYANLDASCPHIMQTGADGSFTNINQMLIIPRGSGVGTNIVYQVDPWYQLDVVNVTTSKYTWTAAVEETAKRTYRVTVGVGVSNNVTVVARAKVSDELENLGITDDNIYRDAVLEWLSAHQDAFGHDWADPDCDEPRLADLVNYPDATVITNLTLTQMYWLDMDPTIGGLALMPSVIQVTPRPAAGDETNLRLRIFAMITNRTDDAASEHYGEAWAPYVLRAAEPGVTSWDYTPDAEWTWTSETFKVTGILQTGHTSRTNPDNWLALRWFVFNRDSFRGKDDPEAPFTADVEINDPFGRQSPAYTGGWWEWVEEHGATPAFYFWTIDTRLKPFTVEQLEKINYYE